MPRLLLVRHAQSTWNAEGRWQGWADPPLSDLGRRQARAAAGRLPWEPARWVASDLDRARETAGLLAAPTGGVVTTDEDLREYDAGEWTGLRRADIEARWPDRLAAWDAGAVAAPGGEEPAAFLARLLDALARIAAGEGDVVVVSHGRAIHTAGTALGAPASYVAHLGGIELDGVLPVGTVSLVPPDLVAPRVSGPPAL